MLLAMRRASQRLGGFGIALIGVADIGESLSVRVHILEAAV